MSLFFIPSFKTTNLIFHEEKTEVCVYNLQHFLLFLELFDFKNFFEQSNGAKNGQSWPHPYSSKFPQEPIGVNDICNSLVHQKEMSRFFMLENARLTGGALS